MPKTIASLDDLDDEHKAMIRAYEEGGAPVDIAAAHKTTPSRVNMFLYRMRAKGLVARATEKGAGTGRPKKGEKSPVTAKQKQVLEAKRAGKRNAEIARETGLSTNSVHSAANQLRRKGLLEDGTDDVTAPMRRRLEAIDVAIEELAGEKARLEGALAILGGKAKGKGRAA